MDTRNFDRERFVAVVLEAIIANNLRYKVATNGSIIPG